jgi:Protein of unknown function (DUF664)
MTPGDGEASMDDPLGVRRSERATLEGALDWYRAVVERKVDGLSFEQGSRVMTPSGLSLLGVVTHLGWVERGWFREIFAGEPVESVDSEGDNTAEFVVSADETVESVLAFYRHEVAQSRAVAAASSLDSVSANQTKFGDHVSLRWILVHMLEETARHAGHMDLMREAIDGRLGD